MRSGLYDGLVRRRGFVIRRECRRRDSAISRFRVIPCLGFFLELIIGYGNVQPRTAVYSNEEETRDRANRVIKFARG
jgi:hypothetical protein